MFLAIDLDGLSIVFQHVFKQNTVSIDQSRRVCRLQNSCKSHAHKSMAIVAFAMVCSGGDVCYVLTFWAVIIDEGTPSAWETPADGD